MRSVISDFFMFWYRCFIDVRTQTSWSYWRINTKISDSPTIKMLFVLTRSRLSPKRTNHWVPRELSGYLESKSQTAVRGNHQKSNQKRVVGSPCITPLNWSRLWITQNTPRNMGNWKVRPETLVAWRETGSCWGTKWYFFVDERHSRLSSIGLVRRHLLNLAETLEDATMWSLAPPSVQERPSNEAQ